MPARISSRFGLAALIAIVTAAEIRAQVVDPSLVVVTSIDASRARIGDRLTLDVSLTGPPDISRAHPIVGGTLGGFVVAEIVPEPPQRSGGRFVQLWRLGMTTFDHGRQVIPRVTVEGQFSDGRGFSAASTNEIGIAIAAPAATAADQLKPVTPVIEVPAGGVWSMLGAIDWLLASVVAVAGALVIAVWPRVARWYQRHAFWRRLIADAHALRRAELVAVRQQYTAALALLRRGVGRSIDQVVESYTTTEMIVCVAALGVTGARIGPVLWTVMNHLDEFRFSGAVPDDRMRNRALDEVIAMLRALREIAMAPGRVRS